MSSIEYEFHNIGYERYDDILFAIETGNFGAVRGIYETERFGIDVHLNDHNDTWTHVSAEYGHPEILMYFHGLGCSIFKKNTLGEEPMHLAAKEGHIEIVKYLHSHHAMLDIQTRDGWTPVHYAALNNNVPMLSFFVEHCHANLTTQDKYFKTPLHWAAQYGHKEAVLFFLENGVNDRMEDEEGRTPLALAQEKGRADVIDVFKLHKTSLEYSVSAIMGKGLEG